jgi:hypothetical protein
MATRRRAGRALVARRLTVVGLADFGVSDVYATPQSWSSAATN